MIKIDYSGIDLEKVYDYQGKDYKLAVFGYCFGQIPEKIYLDTITKLTIQQLNFDGAYAAFFEDCKTGTQIVFHSHIDTFSLFYVRKNDTLHFSNDFYKLVPYINSATWDLDAVADYFEDAWNNIVKYDRSPLREIRRLDTWRYMVIYPDREPMIESWKNLPSEQKYSMANLDEFKAKFFETIDYYLRIIYERYPHPAFSISGGIDANTLAAEYSRLYPNDKAIFYTSKFDDVNDESRLAANMQKCLSSEIRYIPVEITNSDVIERLHNYISRYVPPRFFNELSEENFVKTFAQERISYVSVNGIGADLAFGGFSDSYFPLIDEFLDQNRIEEAFDVFIAAQVSFERNTANLPQLFYNYCMNYSAKNMHDKLVENWSIMTAPRTGGGGTVGGLLKCELPLPESSKIKDYKSRINYSTYEGGLRTNHSLCSKFGIKSLSPHEGYKMAELTEMCDPHIFCNRVNKFCLRYAVRDLLPSEIVNYPLKRGNPGMRLSKVMGTGNNYQNVRKYLETHSGNLVNNAVLLQHLNNGKFEHKDFLGLSLLMFEEIFKEKYGLIINVT